MWSYLASLAPKFFSINIEYSRISVSREFIRFMIVIPFILPRLQINKAYLTSKTKLQVALDATGYRLENFQSLCEKMEEKIEELVEHKTAARAENDRLLVKLQNLR